MLALHWKYVLLSERINMRETMSLKKTCQWFYFPWNVIRYLWCLESEVPKRSHPNMLLTSVLLDTFLISLMAFSLKQAKHIIFRTSVNMWWKILHVCLSNVQVGFRQHFIPAQTFVKFNFLDSKRFFQNSIVLKLSSRLCLICKWNWMVTKLIKNLSKRCKKT